MPPAFTGTPQVHNRRRRGKKRGVVVALPESDAGIDTVSAGGVTVYRGPAGTLPAFTGALPATTRGFAGTLPAFTGALPATNGA
ncbi:hypothetical protein DPMN_092322 [Dreissena polymorpha]|uniref:Uncharacterized protein n=1 Tax=Dreissena polymorpha TaxID=45954 RepID=A0A9D4L223_DREPO|nr:hypothetical protein DPMN_092322 [Dreissena polymorpha]